VVCVRKCFFLFTCAAQVSVVDR